MLSSHFIGSPVFIYLQSLSKVFLDTIYHLASEFLRAQKANSRVQGKTILLSESSFKLYPFLSLRCPYLTAGAFAPYSSPRFSCNCYGLAKNKRNIPNHLSFPRADFLLLAQETLLRPGCNTVINPGLQTMEALENCPLLPSTCWSHCCTHSKSGFLFWGYS